MPYDLILKGGEVIDPSQELRGVRDVGIRGGKIAAVVMEPTNVELPKPGYLEGIRKLTIEHGAFLIFDEVVTGFRLAKGGAQEYFGVVPDLACVGKAMASGMGTAIPKGRSGMMAYFSLMVR